MERLGSNKGRTIAELLGHVRKLLSVSSTSPHLDAELLLMHVSGLPHWKVIAERSENLDPAQEQQLLDVAERRRNGEPIAYITGTKEFWGLPFAVQPGVLIPRPESEILIEEALAYATAGQRDALRILDLGTGSGCLAVTLAVELKKRGAPFTVAAVDISRDALAVARHNAALHGAAPQISFFEGNWFEALPGDEQPFTIIVANPPYVGRNETVSPDTRFEPDVALFAEDDGLREAKCIVEAAPRFLTGCGILLCEVGAGKRKLLGPWLAEIQGVWKCELLGDDSPDDRFTVIKLERRIP